MSKVSSSAVAIPVAHIAKLASIPITTEEQAELEKAFAETLTVVADLKTIDVTGVQPTFQVTGLENIWRVDVVDTDHMFSQDQALANVPSDRRHDGYVVVPQVIDQA